MATSMPVQAIPGTQTLRFRRPQNDKPKPTTKPKNRHAGILQDQLRRAQKAPWCPSFSLAFRIFLLVRVTGAMYANIQDCDEVFNFWEPLHYLDRGYGFQTWETSPKYALRSWAYILFHLFPAKLITFMFGPEKRLAFFSVRIFLALLSSLAEAFLYRTVVDHINYRAGRYMMFMMLFSAGMWSASVAFLPSSFAMYANAVGFAFSILPTTSDSLRRTLFGTLAYATGAILGWPFSLAVAIPFVFEELFMHSGDTVMRPQHGPWARKRLYRMIGAAGVASLLFLPVVALDTLFYGKLTIVPWNIIKYNVFPDSTRGPNLYGTAPADFYVHNLLLNFNVLVPFALASLPALLLTHRIDKKRLGDNPPPGKTSPYAMLAVRLAPFYLWFIVMSAQAHKEERFMYPIYPMLCFNAAVTLYLIRGYMEVAYIGWTKSPYQASRTAIFSRFTLSVISTFIVLSVSRGMALWKYYHAPMALMNHFEGYELPAVLNATNFINLPPPKNHTRRRVPSAEEEAPRIPYELYAELDMTLCVGKQWYEFPGNYLVPDGIKVEWVKSEFDGMLPGKFKKTLKEKGLMERPKGTKAKTYGLNDQNKEEFSFYTHIGKCDYLLDLDFPLHPRSSPLEPRHIADTETWDRVKCEPYLDAQHSPLLTRALWMPGKRWQEANEFGEFCLLRHKRNWEKKEKELKSVGARWSALKKVKEANAKANGKKN